MRKPEIAELHLITSDHPTRSHLQLIEEACMGGVTWVQLRIKDMEEDVLAELAMNARRITHKYNAVLIINDHIRIAKAVDADGVHLGKKDESPAIARSILGPDKIIGGTANTIEDIERLTALNVDYIGAGPFRFTTTKKDLSPVLGIEGISLLAKATSIPVIAIGGIDISDITSIRSAKIHGVAVAGAINNAANMNEKIKEFNKVLKKVEDDYR
jgi:thiamine-phosphate pyrophosphorylase